MPKTHHPSANTFGEVFHGHEEELELRDDAPDDSSVMPERRSYQGDEFDGENRRADQTRDSGVDGLHSENLFDQDHDEWGNLVDERDQRRFDNSTFTDERMVLDAGGYIVQLGADGEEPDFVDAWLAHQEGDMLNVPPGQVDQDVA